MDVQMKEGIMEDIRNILLNVYFRPLADISVSNNLNLNLNWV